MFLRRAAGVLRRLQIPLSAPIDATLFSSVARSCETKFLPEHRLRFSSWTQHKRDFALWIFLSGHAGIILGISSCYAMAEDKSVDGSFNENGAGEALLTGLRRIEDGSVVSNEHTSKWRIFTDNGRDQFQKGKLHEAEKYFLLALKEAKEGFGERDPHVASAYNNLAELYRVRKAFDKAEPLYLEAINILEESFGPDDIRVGAALHNLGQFYLGQRKLEEARICYERALKIKGRVLGLGHLDYANTMYHLGTVLNLQGKVKDAEALIQDSIRILEEAGLRESVTCIRRMRYLSQVYLKSNKVGDAENLQRKILHVLELSKGWDSLDTVNAAEGLALTLLSVGNLREAHELLERCLKVRKKILHDNHIQVGATMLHLARVAMLNSNRLRKINASEASIELDKAKCLLDNSIRIASSVIDNAKENKSEGQSNGEAHAALVILLQSLDSLALLEITRCELQESKEANTTALEAQRALRQCISIMKEPGVRTWALQLPDVKAEYLSCLRRLLSLLDESNGADIHELKEEIRSMEADLFSSKNRKNRR